MTVHTRLPEIRDQAKGRWRAILSQFDVPATFFDGKQRPCPVCGGTDRARFDDLEGHGTWYCNQCGAGNGMSLVMKLTGLGFAEAARRVRELLPDAPVQKGKPPRDEDRCAAAHREVWGMGHPLAGTMAEIYFRGRGCWTETVARSPHLRFVPRLRAKDHEAGFLAALIARVCDPAGHGINIHRTFLLDGRKVYRAMMPGAIPAGSAIRIGTAGSRMGIAEGLETAIHASIRSGETVWSAIAADNLARWEPPPGVDHVDIWGDHDESFTGQAVSYALARKLRAKRVPIGCAVHIPDQIGFDWADVGQRSAEAA